MKLQRLKTLPLNQLFNNEQDFTPWLQANPKYLEHVLDVKLAPTIRTQVTLEGGLISRESVKDIKFLFFAFSKQ